jgi:hypothetical protein
MALYSFANGLSINASKLLCRARYIILTCCGENHPQISLIDVKKISFFKYIIQKSSSRVILD